MSILIERLPYVCVVLLIVVGLYGIVIERNLFKKVIGLGIFQAACILFFIVISVKSGSSVPIIDPSLGVRPELYANPIPHGLMLTAIVVSVALTGVALSLIISIYRRFQSLDEEVILEKSQ